ncbi:histidine phosphatase family protein [Streptosporangium pseudovulgare]|uniref:Phosphoglycerate mutase n=1 Tax=Streptosporangium pseudovulgare TaxID=35765 RepID=A0ABQ2RHE1_9ACTN|nr:histidine phosphatase family protein [Streptosporangium pseudovulgare]GGQ30961.1 phosphoglycerate mutase [Streptosporangium pseudovulgare]
MLFVRQAGTPGTRSACFPTDEPADAASLRKAERLRKERPGPALAAAVTWVAPVTAARQTAAALGSEAIDAPELAEADAGRWRGLPYAKVAETEPDGLAAWLGDPRAAPHGGESLARLAARVSGWLDAAAAEAVVICDVGVIRAALGHALGLGPLETARFDVAPLSTTELVPVRGGWRVAHVNRKVIT